MQQAELAALISGPPAHLVVRARQKLKTPEDGEAFINELQNRINEIVDSGTFPSFEDLDISQNKLPADQFESMFSYIVTSSTRIERIRMFGCPTVDDSVMNHVAGWIGGCVADKVPSELHLSDCAITTDGFHYLMEAFENNENFPVVGRDGGRHPVYVRLENNYIDEAAIQAKVDEGVIAQMRKGERLVRSNNDVEPKIKLLVRDLGKYQQKQGAPPDPEDAPPPKPVWDKSSWEAPQPAKGAFGKGGYKGAWRPQGLPALGMARPHIAPAAQLLNAQNLMNTLHQIQFRQQAPFAPLRTVLATPHTAARPLLQPHIRPATPRFGDQGRPQLVGRTPTTGIQPTPKRGKAAGGKGSAGSMLGGGKGAAMKGTSGTSTDRSRTPAPKPKPPAGPPVPAPWEVHFSDEYNIPYYWNAETGESLWEKLPEWGE